MFVLSAVRAHGPLVSWLVAHESVAVWITGVATGGLALGVWVAWRSLGDSEKTRHAQLITELSKRWGSKEIASARQLANEYGADNLAELATKLFGPNAPRPVDPKNRADWISIVKFPDFLEAIGVVTLDKALPARMVFQMWGPVIIAADEQWRPSLAVLREHDSPTTHRYFSWLATEMRREQAKDEDDWDREHPNPVWFS
jgi:hypothetical protein